jgi:hypothetical protein
MHTMSAIGSQRPTKGARSAEHQLALGRARPYAPRTTHTRAIAERTRVILADLAALQIKPTTRQLFYILVDDALIAKTAKGYELVKEQSGRMRKGGWIAMDAVIDGTRSRTEWSFHACPSDALLDAAESYASDPWATQPEVRELWCEADTHREMLRPLAAEMCCPLVVTRGSPSWTLLNDSVAPITWRWQEKGQRTRIIYVGDHDPAGLDMSRNLHARLVELHMPPEACTVVRVALTEEQIRERALPTRPPKKGDTRTRWYEAEFPGLGCVELDALPPQELAAIVRAALWDSMPDQETWAQHQERAQEERLRLIRYVQHHKESIDRKHGCARGGLRGSRCRQGRGHPHRRQHHRWHVHRPQVDR